MFSNPLNNLSRRLIFIRNNPGLLFRCWISDFSSILTKSNPSLESNTISSLNNQFNGNYLFQNRYLFSESNLVSKNKEASKPKNPNLEQQEGNDDILYKSIQLEARSADRGVLDSYEKFVLMAGKFLDIPISRVWEPFRSIKRRTLLRSAFVKKKYRVQYEFRTYFRNIELKYLTGSTADTFLEYIERNLPEGTALKVTRKRLEKIPSHLKPPQPE